MKVCVVIEAARFLELACRFFTQQAAFFSILAYTVSTISYCFTLNPGSQYAATTSYLLANFLISPPPSHRNTSPRPPKRKSGIPFSHSGGAGSSYHIRRVTDCLGILYVLSRYLSLYVSQNS